MRIGGQAEVLVYTGDNPVMNLLGAVYIRADELALLSLLSADEWTAPTRQCSDSRSASGSPC